MLRILVSSTFRDLEAERQVLREEIEALAGRGLPVQWVGMEAFGARASSAYDTSTDEAARADLVLLLVARSVGSRAPDRRETFTVAEFEVVLRDKLPCLAYLQQADEEELAADVEAFRRRVRDELVTSKPWRGKADLRVLVRRDLETLLADLGSGSPTLVTEPPALPASAPFEGRDADLRKLGQGLEAPAARVAIWGPRGIGKTTLAIEYFRRGRSLLEPLWLRVDELFGRHPHGSLQLGRPRWERPALAEALRKLLADKPRGVLVFDNVQAAPRDVMALAAGLPNVPMLFLSWDAATLPPHDLTLRLATLDEKASQRTLEHYCAPAQSADGGVLAALAERLGHHPFALTLAGRRLRAQPALRVDELLAQLTDSTARLRLAGASADAQWLSLHAMLLNAYHCLPAASRFTLAAFAAVPAPGVSEATAHWLARAAGDPAPPQAVEHAESLGLIERRSSADWRGHRWRLRSLVADFLKTTDAYGKAGEAVSSYLASREVFDDLSIDVVSEALRGQLASAAPGLPLEDSVDAPDWADRCLANGRRAMRLRLADSLCTLSNPQQVAALAVRVGELLARPHGEGVALDLLALLSACRQKASAPLLERLWREPDVIGPDGVEESSDLQEAAGRALAACEGLSWEEFLGRQLRGADRRAIEGAVQAAAKAPTPVLVAGTLDLLSSKDRRVRHGVALRLQFWNEPAAVLRDRLLEMSRSDADEEVRAEAIWTLGVWTDERALTPLLAMFGDPDGERRATVLSVLHRFYNPQTAEIFAAAARDDPDRDVRTNAIFALVEARDLRAVPPCLALLDSGEAEQRRTGAFFVSLFGPASPGIERGPVVDAIAGLLASTDLQDRLAARSALLRWHDARAMPGLPSDLRPRPGDDDGTLRCLVLQGLAIWQPPGIDALDLRPLLHDADPEIRASAALVAGQLKADALVEELKLLLDDRTPLRMAGLGSVADEASKALDRIAGLRPPWQAHRRKPTPIIGSGEP